MIKPNSDIFIELKNSISKEKRIIKEISKIYENPSDLKDASVKAHINSLKLQVNQENKKVKSIIDKIILAKKLDSKAKASEINKKANSTKEKTKKEEEKEKSLIQKIMDERKIRKLNVSDIDKNIAKRILKKKIKKAKEKEAKPNTFAGISSRLFSEASRSLSVTKWFGTMISDLIKTNLQFVPTVYISMMIFSTIIASGIAVLFFLFLLFFKISPSPPFLISISPADIISRFMSTFWILFLIPIGTFLSMYFYPGLEKKSLEASIDQELPFATINMSAIAGSRIEPTNIFKIIVSTGEYPNLKIQFTKILNELNIYGHDLVTALRSAAFGCPSKKLSDLYNGLATNITSGGNLGEFFEKRSQTLLLDYRLQRERDTRSSETFIDIYISIVIAAPMILMLLLVMIQVSGLGISMSPTILSLIMVLGVALINVVFLMILRFKQPKK